MVGRRLSASTAYARWLPWQLGQVHFPFHSHLWSGGRGAVGFVSLCMIEDVVTLSCYTVCCGAIE